MNSQEMSLSHKRKKEYIKLILDEVKRCNDETTLDFVYTFLWKRRSQRIQTKE